MTSAYIVCGPEASGNRYLVRLLVAAGSAGAGEQRQPFDADDGVGVRLPAHCPPRIAFYRSFPHGRIWPDLGRLLAGLRRRHVTPTVLVLVRNGMCVERSQLRAGHVASIAQARKRISLAYRAIFRGLEMSAAPSLLVQYELLGNEPYRNWLVERLGLTWEDQPEAFVDGNVPYEVP